MGWLKNLFGRYKSGEDEVVIVSTPGKILKAVKTYEKGAVDDNLAPFFADFAISGYRFLFFDPEENACYTYHLNDDFCIETGQIDLNKWAQLSESLKSINNRIITIKDKELLCCANFSLTNLGERTSVILIDPETEPEILKELKRKAIQTVNRLKPATSLTHNNIRKILEIIDRRKENLNGNLYDLFLQDNLITKDEANRLRESNDFISLIKKPAARKQVVSNVAKWLGVDYFDVEIDEYDKYSEYRLPEETAKKFGALLIGVKEDTISAAFVDPFDETALNEVERITGKKIKPYMACEEDIRYEQEKRYSKRR
jgi:hypothetical protein